MKGLLGAPALQSGQALIIEPAAQVHTFGLRYPIDVLFCDRDHRVVHIVRDLAPWRLSKWVRAARYVVELPEGAIPAWLDPGAQLSIALRSGPRPDL